MRASVLSAYSVRKLSFVWAKIAFHSKKGTFRNVWRGGEINCLGKMSQESNEKRVTYLMKIIETIINIT